MMEDSLDDARRLGARQADFAVNDIGEIRSRQRPGVRPPDVSGIRHFYLPSPECDKSII
jgi:hypothetical protein